MSGLRAVFDGATRNPGDPVKNTLSFTWAHNSLILFLGLVLAACDPASKEDPPTDEPAETNGAPAAAAPAKPTPLTATMRESLGAATLIPSDASYFSSTHGLKKRWDALVESEAVKKLLELPGALMLQQQILQAPQYRQLQQQLTVNPLLAKARDVLVDAVSSEIFVYGDARLASMIQALASDYGSVFIPDPSWGPGGPSPRRAIETALELKDDLRIPGFVVGFALEKPEEARQLLADALRALAAAGPGPPIIEQKIGSRLTNGLQVLVETGIRVRTNGVKNIL